MVHPEKVTFMVILIFYYYLDIYKAVGVGCISNYNILCNALNNMFKNMLK